MSTLQTLPLRYYDNNVVLIDSRVIAEALGIQHESLVAGINRYRIDIEKSFGMLRFEIGASNSGQHIKYAVLTEDQAIYIGTLSRNSEKVVEFKARLVKSFSEARKLLQKSQIPQTLPEALRAYAAELEQKEALQKTIELQAPKIALADACLTAGNNQTITQVSKVLGIGRNILCDWLRKEKIFYQIRSENVAFQHYMDMGYFVSKERSIEHSDRFQNHTQPLVTPKGLQFLEEKIRKAGGVDEVVKSLHRKKVA